MKSKKVNVVRMLGPSCCSHHECRTVEIMLPQVTVTQHFLKVLSINFYRPPLTPGVTTMNNGALKLGTEIRQFVLGRLVQ